MRLAFRTILLVSMLALFGGLLRPQTAGVTELDAASTRLQSLSDQLRNQAQGKLRAKPTERREAAVSQDRFQKAVATERLALMEALARHRPDAVLRAMLSEEERSAMAREGVPVERVEETLAEVSVTVHDGFQEAPSVFEIGFTDGSGPAFASPEQAGGLACGDTARLQLLIAGSGKVVARSERLAASNDARCNSLGEQRIAVILMHRPGSQPATNAAFWQQKLFGADTMSVTDYVAAASYGKASVQGTVFGWYAADRNYGCGELDTVRRLALSAAAKDIDFNRYSRLILIYEAGTSEGCGAGGYGTLGCQLMETPQGQKPISVSWLFARDIAEPAPATPPLAVAIHELGHNLGLHHARSLHFQDEVLAASTVNGRRSEYGDTYSIMGGTGDLSARHKHLLGWLEADRDIQTVTSSGEYTLSRLQSGGPLPRALRVRRSSDSNEWLWLEARLPSRWEQPVGFTAYEAVNQGVFLHYQDAGDPANERYTDRLTTAPSEEDPRVSRPKLKAGEPWRDRHGPLRLDVVHQTEEMTVVRVDYVEPCASVAPPGTTISSDGGTFTFSVQAAPSCSWEVASDAAFASYTGTGTAAGPGTVTFTFGANDSASPRHANLTVGNRVYTITQASKLSAPAVKSIDFQGRKTGFGMPLAFQVILQDGQGVLNLQQVELRVGTAPGKALCAVSVDMPSQQFSVLGSDLRTPVHTSSLRTPVAGDSALCRFTVLGYRWDLYERNLGEIPITFQVTLESPLPGTAGAALAFYARVTGLDGRSTDWTRVRSFSLGEECVIRTAGSQLVLDQAARVLAYRVTAPEGCLWSAEPGETGLRFDTGWRLGTDLLPMSIPAGDGHPQATGEPGQRQTAGVRFEVGTQDKLLVRAPGRSGEPAVPGAESIVHGATFSRPIAYGSWISIFGSNLAATTSLWTEDDFAEGYLPLGLQGVEVLVNGQPVPVSFAGAGQLNALLPEMQGEEALRIQVRSPFGTSREIELATSAAAPGVFVYHEGGVAYAAAQHGDSTAVGPLAASEGAVVQRPARPGDTIAIYGTGFGRTAPLVDEQKRLTNAASLMNRGAAQVTIGGVACDLEFIGKSANGLYQANVRVPSLTKGNHRLVVKIGNAESQPSVWVRVEP